MLIGFGYWIRSSHVIYFFCVVGSFQYVLLSLLAECRHFGGAVHPHGSHFSPKRCVDCECDNGHINCTRRDPITTCPKLSCPESEQVLQEGQCCKTCKADFCSRGHDCHPELAVCVNGLQNYTCHCKAGFKGDGKHCEGKAVLQGDQILIDEKWPKSYEKCQFME